MISTSRIRRSRWSGFEGPMDLRGSSTWPDRLFPLRRLRGRRAWKTHFGAGSGIGRTQACQDRSGGPVLTGGAFAVLDGGAAAPARAIWGFPYLWCPGCRHCRPPFIHRQDRNSLLKTEQPKCPDRLLFCLRSRSLLRPCPPRRRLQLPLRASFQRPGGQSRRPEGSASTTPTGCP
jgi:hypothetical protein